MLDLSYHLIGDKGMLAVGKVLQKWVALTTLVLKGNGIRDEAALVLAASLRGRKLPKIVYIDLSDNQVRRCLVYSNPPARTAHCHSLLTLPLRYRTRAQMLWQNWLRGRRHW
eukprot:COSAG02_NODE_712_length_18122_cov_6.792321_17_plen_112_part_00